MVDLMPGFGVSAAIQGFQWLAAEAVRVISRGWRGVKNCCAGTDSFSRRVVGVTPNLQLRNALRCAAFHAGWEVVFVTSPEDAGELLASSPVDALFFDHDCIEDDWRRLCSVCLERNACFHLVARSPSDTLFLSVVGAGGSSVLWKPITSEQIVAAVNSAAHATLIPSTSEVR